GVNVTTSATNGLNLTSATEVSTGGVDFRSSTDLDSAISQLDSAITTLRGHASTLGSNVALLQTRLDFTNAYVNDLEGGAAKLTLADINEEGANLVSLQTRQQLGISALAFAGQSEQSVLALFR
ncbi:MAG: flagellin, partial [Alphaproteobacteria bacterium]